MLWVSLPQGNSLSMRKTLLQYGAVGVGIIALLLLFFFNPEQYPIYPRCPFILVTGYKCPGCGSLRFTHSLLQGNFTLAWHYNPVLFVSLPFLFFLFYIGRIRKKQKWAEQCYLFINSKISIALMTLFIIIWWIGRNL